MNSNQKTPRNTKPVWEEKSPRACHKPLGNVNQRETKKTALKNVGSYTFTTNASPPQAKKEILARVKRRIKGAERDFEFWAMIAWVLLSCLACASLGFNIGVLTGSRRAQK